MRLKRVRIFGFKTFADRSEFSLEGGVVAVIGPNGCGKSNLVDAILWGLGEGNARQLRAQTGQDVIFSGSARRKALGYAEVSLLFDNEDGALPIDTPEVSITRRVTRNGESEYSINRSHCRLRDIHDLLADSGLGRAGYSIVGQKETDAAVSASAEDRRAWIDEAAGVQRYRVRKIDSLKRLEQAQEHLSRVGDILTELENQREPLRAEAEVATNYRNVLNALREVELGQLIFEVCKAIRDVEEAEQRIEQAQQLARAESERAERLEEDIAAATGKLAELDGRLEALRTEQQANTTAEERATANLRVLEERLSGLGEQERNFRDDSVALTDRIREVEVEVAEANTELASELSDLEALQTEVGGSGKEAAELQEELKRLEVELQSARNLETKRFKQEAEQSMRVDRVASAERELAGVNAAIPELEAAILEAQASSDVLSASDEGASLKIKELERSLAELQSKEQTLAQENRRALAERAAVEGRIRGIEATINAHEGLTQGSRAVLEAVGRKELLGSYVPVGDAVEADRELALAIETALGASANDLIVEDAAAAKQAIEWLKSRRAGRATFQPIPLMKPSHLNSDLPGKAGVVGRASDLVRCSSKHRPVVESLLGRIVVVETIDDALRYAKTSGWSRLVTLQGEVQHSGGAVTGGQHGHHSYGLVQRRADLLELEDQLSSIDEVLRGLDASAGKIELQRSALQNELEELRSARALSEGEREDARQFLRTLSDELKDTLKQQTRLTLEIETIRTSKAEPVIVPDIVALDAARDAAMRELAAKSADAESAETRLRDLESRVRTARNRVDAANKRLQGANDQHRHREQRLSGIGPERERLLAEAQATTIERDAAHQRALDSQGKIFVAQGERRELADATRSLGEALKEARDNALAIGTGSHQAELARARAESKRASAQERLLQEYGMSEDDALDQEGRHEVPADAASLAPRLRRELKAMGDVNLGAIEAFDRLTQRLEELGAQRQDILEGIEQVEASIRELDKLTRHRFISTFEAVQEAFAEIFKNLFGGGEGALALSNPERILDSGIDLIVQLPGKKRQPLALLSGGERSLCASAFLFALLKVKPSPLVVMDEVDAPLDGANVERFARALQEFSAKTQFIVITHNTTTIETIPVWLGVSMQEPGVSTLLPTTLPGRVPPEGEPELALN
jgi:chromosome segregation protein